MSRFRLPNDQYKYTQSSYSSFNNQLLSGINSGLSLYDTVNDTKLYKPTNWKPLDSISFDEINNDLDKYDKDYNKQDDIYHNSKSSVAGAIAGISKSADDTVQKIINEIKKIFTFDTSGIKTYAGLFLLFLIVYKKL